jgi:DNA-binding IclR family transcriptional regulator
MTEVTMASSRRRPLSRTPKVESVIFADQILNCFSVDAPVLGVTQIAQILGVPKARVHRFLSTMEQIGYVRRDAATDRYSLGMRLYGLGMLAVNGASYLERISVKAQEFSEHFGYTAVVGIWADNEFAAIRTFIPPRSLSVAIHTGFHSPAYVTAQGRVFLAFLPPEELDHYFQATELRALTTETLTDPSALRSELDAIREHLYAAACNQASLGVAAVAAPVFDIQGRVQAVISLVWFTPELVPRIAELGTALRQAGLVISAELGFRIPPAWQQWVGIKTQ